MRHKYAENRRAISKTKKEIKEFLGFDKIKIKGRQEITPFGVLDHTGCYQ